MTDTIVDFSELILRKSRLSDKSIGILLRIFHFNLAIFPSIVLLFGSKMWFKLILLFNILIVLCFFIFHGCLLSKIEHRFTYDDFTVIDPFLEFIGVETTNENRSTYSLYSFIFGFIFTLLIYYYRFGSTNK